MGYIPSATTLTATAYLTDRGRAYLFNQGNIRFDNLGDDLFQITQFTFGDPDANYQIPHGYGVGEYSLDSGDVPDVSGKSEGCLKTAVDFTQNNLLIFEVLENNTPSNVQYNTDLSEDINGNDGVTIHPKNLATTSEQAPTPIVIGPGGGNATSLPGTFGNANA